MRYKSLLQTAILFLGAFFLLSYSDDPPDGRTGAPFNGRCSDCHTSNNPNGYNGVAELIGLPDTIQPNTIYPLQLKITVSAGNPVRAGFQVVVVDDKHLNTGDLNPVNNETGTDFLNGREYLDHRGGKYFGSGPISWAFKWTSPDSVSCNRVHFYYIINLCNGGGDFGDYSITFSKSHYFAQGPLLNAVANTLQNNNCIKDSNGIAQVQISGGITPYTYNWSNGLTDANIEMLANGTYSVTIVDGEGCLAIDSTNILHFDSIPPKIICPLSFSVCAGDTVHHDLPALSDNCMLGDTQLMLLSGLPNDTIYPLGITELVFQAMDQSGNTVICSFQVEVDPCPTGTIDPINEAEMLFIVPNPVRENHFFIYGEETPLALELINFQGQIVKALPVSAWPGPFLIEHVPEGVYILRIIAEDRRQRLLTLFRSR